MQDTTDKLPPLSFVEPAAFCDLTDAMLERARLSSLAQAAGASIFHLKKTEVDEERFDAVRLSLNTRIIEIEARFSVVDAWCEERRAKIEIEKAEAASRKDAPHIARQMVDAESARIRAVAALKHSESQIAFAETKAAEARLKIVAEEERTKRAELHLTSVNEAAGRARSALIVAMGALLARGADRSDPSFDRIEELHPRFFERNEAAILSAAKG